MRVLFDHQVFSWQTYGGISRYFVEIAKGLQERGHTALFPEGFYSENVYIRSISGIKASPITPFSHKGKKWLQERLGRSASLNALQTTRPDVFHATYFGDYYLKTVLDANIPFAITIHDMIHEKYAHGGKGFFSLDANVVANKRLLAHKAQAVVVVSDNTKRDVLTYIPDLDPAKIHIIHHGNSMEKPEPEQPNKLALPDRYLLFVGQRNAYKNFSWMLTQLAEVLRVDNSLHLVCAGGPAFDSAETAQITKSGLNEKVLHPVIRSDADLAELYARAQCFIFPSNYEGFGMPVVEAFSCGCPCVLNHASSLPEVGGDAALYFNENDGAALVKAVEGILRDTELRTTLVAKGYERATLFTWEKSVDQHIEVYRKMAGSP